MLKDETALVEVAVLSAYRKRFDMWVEDNGKEGEKYICVTDIRDTRGRVFSRVEKSYDWWEMKNANDVEKAAILRCRLRNY